MEVKGPQQNIVEEDGWYANEERCNKVQQELFITNRFDIPRQSLAPL